MKAKKHIFLPDSQVKPGVPLDHLTAAGNYIVEKQPDVVIDAGDFGDMPSLSGYDPKGSKYHEGKRYLADIESVHHGMNLLMTPLWEYNKKAKLNKHKTYNPQLEMLGGNHEDRIQRAVNHDPKLEGLMSLKDLKYEEFGWRVHPFLQPVIIDGIVYNHYFPSGQMGRPCSSAQAIISKYHMSCVAGHQQGRNVAYGKRGDGKTITSIIAGSFYQHEEEYLNPVTNNHWRGLIVLHEVNDGQFDEMWVSINYLLRRYL